MGGRGQALDTPTERGGCAQNGEQGMGEEWAGLRVGHALQGAWLHMDTPTCDQNGEQGMGEKWARLRVGHTLQGAWLHVDTPTCKSRGAQNGEQGLDRERGWGRGLVLDTPTKGVT